MPAESRRRSTPKAPFFTDAARQKAENQAADAAQQRRQRAEANEARKAERAAGPKKRKTGGDPVVSCRRQAFVQRRVLKEALTAGNVAAAVGKLERGCEIYGLCTGSWSLIDLIKHVLTYTGPADVVLSTWTAANADLTFANKLMTEGAIQSLLFLVDYSFPSRQPAYCEALVERFGRESIRLTKNHAKFVLIRNDRWNVVIRTSMNLNENKRLENFEISDDRHLADFLAGVVKRLFDEETGDAALKKRPIDHVNTFATLFDAAAGDLKASTDTKKYFGDGPFDVDLRRTGLTHSGGVDGAPPRAVEGDGASETGT